MIRTIKSNIVYKDQWMQIREDQISRNGIDGFYTVLERADSIIIIPLSPTNRTILLKQYRYPTKGSSWEFPMGGIELGETPTVAARRELLEETQLMAVDLEPIGNYYPVPGLTSQQVTIFIAKMNEQELDEAFVPLHTDDIQGHKLMTQFEINYMLSKGEILDGFTLVALLHLKLYLEDKNTLT